MNSSLSDSSISNDCIIFDRTFSLNCRVSCSSPSSLGAGSSWSSSPPMMDCSSTKSIRLSPSSSIASTKRSTCDGGRSARLSERRPSLSSLESIMLSLLVSKRPNNVLTSILFIAIQLRKISTTSSATNTTPQSGHFVESSGTSELHAPHSPKASSETPENEIPHSGHSLVLIGTIARQEPHSAMGVSSFSSDIVFPQHSPRHERI